MKCCGLCKYCVYVGGLTYICGATEIDDGNCIINVIDDLEKEGTNCEMFEKE